MGLDIGCPQLVKGAELTSPPASLRSASPSPNSERGIEGVRCYFRRLTKPCHGSILVGRLSKTIKDTLLCGPKSLAAT